MNPAPSEMWDRLREIPGMPAAHRIFPHAPESHPSWKSVMTCSHLGLTNASFLRRQGTETPPNAQNEALLAMRASEFGTPMVWVDRSFLECLLRSDPPDDYAIDQIKWPFPAMIFMLPKGTLVHETDGDCSWLMIGRIGGVQKCPLTGHVIQTLNPTVVVVTAPWENHEPPILNYGIPDEPGFQPFKPLPDYGPPTVDDFSSRTSTTQGFTSGDQALTETALQLGLRLALALSAKPEYLAPAKPGKTIKREGIPRTFEEPRWLGKGHAITTDPAVNLGGNVRLHWRRGHFKNQPHGTGRSLRKLIWIEPYLAGTPN